MKFVIFIVLSILSSLNWGSTGHRVIAEVATNYLTDNARFKINKILDGETLVNASTFADDIKSDSRYDKYYDWHFLNMELDDEYEETDDYSDETDTTKPPTTFGWVNGLGIITGVVGIFFGVPLFF